jgi:hypothetical protein
MSGCDKYYDITIFMLVLCCGSGFKLIFNLRKKSTCVMDIKKYRVILFYLLRIE